MSFPGWVEAIQLVPLRLPLPSLPVLLEHTDSQCEAHACNSDSMIWGHTGSGKSINSQRLNYSYTPVCASKLIYHQAHQSVCVIGCPDLCTITSVELWSRKGRRRVRESPSFTGKRLKWPSPLVNGHKCTYNTLCINTTPTCVNSTTTAIRRHFAERNHLLLIIIRRLMCCALLEIKHLKILTLYSIYFEMIFFPNHFS